MEPRRSFCMASLLSSNILMTSSKGIPLGGLPFDTGDKTTNSTSQVFSLVNDDLVIMTSSGVKDSSEFRFSLSDFNLLHETKKILFGSLLRVVSPNFHNFCWNLVHFLKIKYRVFFLQMDYIKRTFNDEWRQGKARCSYYKVLSSCPVWNIKRMKSLASKESASRC